jgi:transglutaminase-like putative cysteine protease
MLNAIASRLGNLPRDSRDTLFLLLVIAWVLAPQTPHLPLWCSLLAGTVLVWRGWLALENRPLPGRWWLLGLLALTVAATWFTHKTLLGRDAGVTLLVVLLTLKTMELRARRDAFVVFFLGFFCMLSNFFHSQSLLTAFSMVLGLLGLLTVLVNAHMPVGKPPLMQAARTAGWMALLGAPIMVVLFLLFPRVAPLWGLPSDAATARTGLSPSMQVGTIATLALDDSVALRIKFEGLPPPQKDLYFRGPVLSNFDGREWRPPFFSFAARYGVAANLTVAGAPIRYEVTMEPTSRAWLVVLDAAPESPVLPGYQSVMQDDLQWLANRPVTDLVRYKVQSYTTFRHGPAQAVTGLREFVELPSGFNPRTLALAAQIRGEARYTAAGSSTLVQAVLERLRTGGYTYTLDPGVSGKDTADDFWFDRKEGFCEHIASAFVVLMRALDVPARIVTGYQGGERNAVDGFWVVRNSDAHAWAEVWQEGVGWVRVDPTSAVSPGRTGAFQRLTVPQGVVGQALRAISPAFSVQLRATWEAINNGWNQWVLNYTQGKQLDLLKDIGFESPGWEDLSYVLIGIIVLASTLGGAWTLWDSTQHDPWLRLLARARKQLTKAGIESTVATSPRQLAELVLAKYSTTRSQAGDAQNRVLHDWLMQLEMQRYAPDAAASNPAQAHAKKIKLKQLQQQFGTLVWPA